MKVDNNRAIEVFGVRFNGVREIQRYARQNLAKDGVFIGADMQRYPCFDSSDYAHESRFFCNFVFAKSEEELEKKLDALRNRLQNGANYRKYTEDLAPMIYWEGSSCHQMEITECDAVCVLEKKQKAVKKTQARPQKTKLELLMEKLKQE